MATYISRKKEWFRYYQQIGNRLQEAGQHITLSDDNHAQYQAKLIQYLFLNLAHQLKVDHEIIRYGNPHDDQNDNIFIIILNRSGHITFDYCAECISVLGSIADFGSGVTITVTFDTSEKKDAFKKAFITALAEAEEQLESAGDKTPQEYFILKSNPTVKEIFSTASNHIVVLNAEIRDAIDFLSWKEVLGPWKDNDRIRDFYEIRVQMNEPSEIRLIFYKKSKREQFLRYLKKIGLNEK